MLEESALGAGWTVWSSEDVRAILAYRPDIFDGSTFPEACLSTVYVARGRRTRRPEGPRNLDSDAPWLVRLQLEPAVEREPDVYATRSAAIEGAARLTRDFSNGEIDYRSLYQVAREEYLERLDELIGRQ